MFICSGVAVSAQSEDSLKQSAYVHHSRPGFIQINELTGGIGLGETGPAYSKGFFGFTTVNGYQTDYNFIAALGTGLSFYNGGMLVPLFLDFRYEFNLDQFQPQIFVDGGLLFFNEGVE